MIRFLEDEPFTLVFKNTQSMYQLHYEQKQGVYLFIKSHLLSSFK